MLSAHIIPLLCFPLVVFLVFTLHELGHYLMARILGVRVISFDIGLGPRLWRGTDRRGTVWAVHLMPCCGLVKLAGQEDGQDNAALNAEQFCARPIWQRALITLAGPAVNVALALVFLIVAYAGAGVPASKPVVAALDMSSPAAQAGLRVGDEILAVDGKPITRGEELSRLIRHAPNKPMTLRIRTGNEIAQTEFTPAHIVCRDRNNFDCSHGYAGIGMVPGAFPLLSLRAVNGAAVDDDAGRDAATLLRAHAGQLVALTMTMQDGNQRDYMTHLAADGGVNTAHESFLFGGRGQLFYDRPAAAGIMAAAWHETMRIVGGTVYVAAQMFPVERTRFAPQIQMKEAENAGAYHWHMVFFLGALMSVFVALFNLLPLPWLDGGVLLRLALEGVMGYDREQLFGPYIARIVVLIIFMVLAFYHAGDFVTHYNIDL